MVKRFSSGPRRRPEVTVRQKDGSPTWGHDGEVGARRDALVTILGAEPLSLETEPQLPQAKAWTPPGKPVKYEAEDAQVGSCTAGKWRRLARAFGVEVLQIKTSLEERLQSSGKAVVGQSAQAPLSACAQAIASAWTDIAATGSVPQEDKHGEIAFLPKPGKDIGGCKKLENHQRCSATLERLEQKHQFVPGCRPMSVWQKSQAHANLKLAPRDAIAILENVFEKIHQLEPPSKSPQLFPRRVLV